MEKSYKKKFEDVEKIISGKTNTLETTIDYIESLLRERDDELDENLYSQSNEYYYSANKKVYDGFSQPIRRKTHPLIYQFLKTHRDDWVSEKPDVPKINIMSNNIADKKAINSFNKYFNEHMINNHWILDDLKIKREAYKTGVVPVYIGTKNGKPYLQCIKRENFFVDNRAYGKTIEEANWCAFFGYSLSYAVLEALLKNKTGKYNYYNKEAIKEIVANSKKTGEEQGTENKNFSDSKKSETKTSNDIINFLAIFKKIDGKVYKALLNKGNIVCIENITEDTLGEFPVSVWYIDGTFSKDIHSPATVAIPFILEKCNILSETVINLKKKNRPDLTVLSEAVTNAKQFLNKDPEERQIINVSDVNGRGVQNIVSEIPVGPIAENLDIFRILDLKEQETTGINDIVRGAAGEQRTGIYFERQKNIRQRISPIVNSYYLFWRKIYKLSTVYLLKNKKYLLTLPEFYDINEEELEKFDVSKAIVDVKNDLTNESELDKERKLGFLNEAISTGAINIKQALKIKGELLGMSEEQTMLLFSNEEDPSNESLPEAQRDINKVLESKKEKVPINMNANIDYVTYILNYIQKNSEKLEEGQIKKLRAYLRSSTIQAMKNKEVETNINKIITPPVEPEAGQII